MTGFRRPTVGITCTVADIVSDGWEEHAAFSPMTYVNAVRRAGARAVLLVADPEDARNPEDVLRGIDAVIVSGGASDVAPERYGADRRPETAPEEPGRDDFEIALVRAAAEHDVPVLGICRGMQLLNVAYGGTLTQHLPNADAHRVVPAEFADHEVVLDPGSLAARAAGGERERVRSHHHQGVDRVGDGLVVTGRAADDGIVEAIEDPDHPFVLGVLWHPEEDDASRVVSSLVDAARHRR